MCSQVGEMIVDKIKVLIAVLGCLAVSQAGAAEPAEISGATQLCEGYYGGEGPVAGTIVIDDRIFSVPKSGLIVRSGGRLSNPNTLRSGQMIRYVCPPASTEISAMAPRIVRGVWTEPR